MRAPHKFDVDDLVKIVGNVGNSGHIGKILCKVPRRKRLWLIEWDTAKGSSNYGVFHEKCLERQERTITLDGIVFPVFTQKITVGDHRETIE